MVCHLPLKLVKKITSSSQNRTLLSVQSIHAKHNNKVNKHANKHTNKIRKHTKQQSQQKSFKQVSHKIQLVKGLSGKRA